MRHLYIKDRKRLVSLVEEETNSIVQKMQTEDRPNLGGIIGKMRSFNENIVESSGILESKESDVEYLQIISKEHIPNINLRWLRENQYWAYTFFEAHTAPPALTHGSSSPVDERPFATLGGQRHGVLEAYDTAIGSYLGRLLRFAETPSILRNPTLFETFGDTNYRFPGKLLSGAHYAFVPVGVLLAIRYFPNWCLEKAGIEKECVIFKSLTPTREEQPRFAENAEIKRLLWKVQTHVEEFSVERPTATDKDLMSKLQKAMALVIEGDPSLEPSSLPEGIAEAFLRLGRWIWEWQRSDSNRAAEVGRVVTRLAVDFWRAIETNENDLQGRSYNDFVSCFVVDRRAVYFTNFLPLGKDRFTRTLFVDLAMTGFQRGRLLERLTDIASYRIICVRELRRVAALKRGLDDLGRDMHEMPSKNLPPPGSRKIVEWLDDLGRDVREMPSKNLPPLGSRKTVEWLDDIQRQLDGANRFFTYGVEGKWQSEKDHFEMIRERITDLRQERIPGFPTLRDFVERRVVHGVREVERMASQYRTLNQRVQNRYNDVRTGINLNLSSIAGIAGSIGLVCVIIGLPLQILSAFPGGNIAIIIIAVLLFIVILTLSVMALHEFISQTILDTQINSITERAIAGWRRRRGSSPRSG